jgi:hypothetical protein
VQIRTVPLFSYVHAVWEFCALPYHYFMPFFHSAIQFPSCVMIPTDFGLAMLTVACNMRSNIGFFPSDRCVLCHAISIQFVRSYISVKRGPLQREQNFIVGYKQ